MYVTVPISSTQAMCEEEKSLFPLSMWPVAIVVVDYDRKLSTACRLEYNSLDA